MSLGTITRLSLMVEIDNQIYYVAFSQEELMNILEVALAASGKSKLPVFKADGITFCNISDKEENENSKII